MAIKYRCDFFLDKQSITVAVVCFLCLIAALIMATGPALASSEASSDTEEAQATSYDFSGFSLFWSGYYKNELSCWDSEVDSDRWRWSDFNKLRFHLEGHTHNKKIRFEMELDVFSFHGYNEQFYQQDETTNLDRLIFFLDYDPVNLSVGKQEIQWGPGKIWSPTDVFNPYDLTVFHDEERDGENSLKLEYYLSRELKTIVVITPESEDDYFRNALGFSATLDNGTDEDSQFLLSYIEYGDTADSIDYAISSLSLDWKSSGFNWWFELSHFSESHSESGFENRYIKSTLGIDFFLMQTFYCIAEVYYDGGGKSGPDEYTDSDWDKYLNGRVISLGKSYIYLGTQFLLTQNLAFSYGFIKNWSDGSEFQYLYTFYKIYEYTDVIVGMDLASGQPGSEFSVFGDRYSLALKLQI